MSKIVTQDEAILGNDFLFKFNCVILSVENKFSFVQADRESELERERSVQTKQHKFKTKNVELREASTKQKKETVCICKLSCINSVINAFNEIKSKNLII